MISVRQSLAAIARGEHRTECMGVGMLKLPTDLARYRTLIECTRPECIVETGSGEGGSALWFASQPGVKMVISVDIKATSPKPPADPAARSAYDRIAWVNGASSVDPDMFESVFGVMNRWPWIARTMVVLDSLHTAPHVAEEIRLYGPMVTPGCALVVEDGLYDHAPPEVLAEHGMAELAELGGPTVAIAAHLTRRPEWRRALDELLDVASPITQNIDGWWIRT